MKSTQSWPCLHMLDTTSRSWTRHLRLQEWTEEYIMLPFVALAVMLVGQRGRLSRDLSHHSTFVSQVA